MKWEEDNENGWSTYTKEYGDIEYTARIYSDRHCIAYTVKSGEGRLDWGRISESHTGLNISLIRHFYTRNDAKKYVAEEIPTITKLKVYLDDRRGFGGRDGEKYVKGIYKKIFDTIGVGE